MTTSRIAFRREVASEWAIFNDDAGISSRFGVATVVVRRRADELISSAVGMTAAALGKALGQIADPEQGRMRLVALGRPLARSSRVAAHNADRDKLWSALEKSGIVLPRGSRTEAEMTHCEDVLQFSGVIEFAATELPVALEVTRRADAFCLGQIRDSDGLGWENFLPSLELLPKDPAAFLRAAVRQIADGLFVARSFGQFDDALVGSEVFAENDVVDRLQAIMMPVE
ncbi:hypothetical protein ACH4OY_02120 [Micromonospora rubida]|uniref:Uncharacterized protein n=1 Tax=Micromonospora rubida TaxID=2697657 RepID=A0ABW7SFW9_9ACTN